MVEREAAERPHDVAIRQALSTFEEEVRLMNSAQDVIDEELVPVTQSVMEQLPNRRQLPFRSAMAEFHAVVDPAEDLRRWMVDLLVHNMHEVYDRTFAWSPATVEFDLQCGAFIIAVVKGTPVAYMHLTWEVEEDHVVLCIGTIQVEDDCKHSGLGNAMVTTALQIARHFRVDEVMAMVPSGCGPGLSLLRRHRFRTHRTSPEQLRSNSLAKYHVLYRRTREQRDEMFDI